MKITENINLAGLIFTIDDDALLKLQNYLNSIERYFAIKEEGKEVVADIEGRIAELFETKINKNKEVISIEDVNQIIGIMGMPEEFMNEAQTESQKSTSYREAGTRKLYRTYNDKVIGGVCGGLGSYFRIDPVFFRLIFVLSLFFTVGFLIYIILWIVLPEAKTFSQKLEMKGYRVSVNSIYENVKAKF